MIMSYNQSPAAARPSAQNPERALIAIIKRDLVVIRARAVEQSNEDEADRREKIREAAISREAARRSQRAVSPGSNRRAHHA